MKKIFLALLIPSVLHAQPQVDSSKYYLYKAGKDMQRYSGQATAGLCISLVGGVIAVTGASGIKANAPLVAAGGVLSTIGFIVWATSYSHMKRAGIYMCKSGIAYDIPIKKKK